MSSLDDGKIVVFKDLETNSTSVLKLISLRNMDYGAAFSFSSHIKPDLYSLNDFIIIQIMAMVFLIMLYLLFSYICFQSVRFVSEFKVFHFVLCLKHSVLFGYLDAIYVFIIIIWVYIVQFVVSLFKL